MVRAVLKGKRFERLELFPLYIKNRDSKVNYQPKVMRGSAADDMLERVAESSSRYGAKVEVRGGMGYISLR